MANLTPPDQAHQLQLIAFQRKLLRHQSRCSCLNCDHWVGNNTKREGQSGCGLAVGAVPPPAVIVVGCQMWCPDIPF